MINSEAMLNNVALSPCAALVGVLKFFSTSEATLLQTHNIFIVADEVSSTVTHTGALPIHTPPN